MVASAYYIERSVLLPITSVIFCIYAVQLLLERRYMLVPRIPYAIHRMGVFFAGLLICRSVDPHGVFNIVPYPVLWFLGNLATCILSAALVMWIDAQFDAFYVSVMQTRPPCIRKTHRGVYIIIVLTNVFGVFYAISPRKWTLLFSMHCF